MALLTIDSDRKECGAMPPPKEALPNPERGNVYVVQVPSYNSMHSHVLAVFKTAHALERFFKGAMLAQIRYYGHQCRIEEVRSWYTVTEKKVEA